MSKFNRRNFLTSSSGVLASTLLTGTEIAWSESSYAQTPKTLLPVRLTCGANLGYSNLFVAEGAGLFQKYGIDGRVILFDVAFQGTEAVIAGQAETASTVEFPMINYLARGADLIAPCVMQTADDLKIVTLKNITKPDDLIGKKIGLIIGSSAHYGFDQYLKYFKIAKEKVSVINVPAAEQVALFAKGDIDAYIWVEPLVTRGIDMMKGRAHILSPGLETVMKSRIYLQLSRSWADKNTQAVQGILRALIDANEFIKKQPEKAAEFTGKKLNLPPSQVPELIKRGGWDWDVYLDSSLTNVFSEVTSWMRENKRLVAEPPDIRKTFAPSYLKAIDPTKLKGF